MRRALLIVTLFSLGACGHSATPPTKPPQPKSPQSHSACRGDASLDPEVASIPNVHASWLSPTPGEQLYVLEAGTRTPGRPTLVLVHGVGKIGTADFYPVLASLSEKRHVLAVDLPGFGRSKPGESEDFGPERMAQAVKATVHACTHGKIDLLGHSSGGALVLIIAADLAKNVRRLVVADAAGILRPEVLLHGQLNQQLKDVHEKTPIVGKAIEKMTGLLIDAVHGIAPDASSVGDSGLFGDSPPVRTATHLLDYNFGPALDKVRAETLVLWGNDDHVMPPRIAHLLDERVEPSELIFIDDAGHVPMKDQPAMFASHVEEFLDHGLSALRPERREKPKSPGNEKRTERCEDQDDLELSGDFASIELLRCKRFWLHGVRAQRITVHESQGRVEGAHVRDGVVVRDSTFAVTGGELHGDVALTVSNSEVDVAGTRIEGNELAVSAEDDSELVFSVTSIASPKGERLLHSELSGERVRL